MAEDFPDQRFPAFEERPRPAVSWSASGRAICPVLSFRPGGDSLFVHLFPPLFAAFMGRGGAIARHLPRRAEPGHMPSLVRQVVCPHAFQMAEDHAFPAGVSGGRNRHGSAVLDYAGNDSSFLGTISDARGHARNVGSGAARGWCHHRGYGLSQDGWESVRSRFAAARELTKVLALANHAASERRPAWNRTHPSPAVHWDHPGRSSRL